MRCNEFVGYDYINEIISSENFLVVFLVESNTVLVWPIYINAFSSVFSPDHEMNVEIEYWRNL